MKKFKILFTFFAIFNGLSGAFAQNFVQVTRTNQKQTIKLSTEQVLEVKLPRNASNGYVWCEATNTNDIAATKTIAPIGVGDFVHDAVLKKGMIGGAGIQIIRYVGTSQGTTVLTLELRRPWEKNSSVIDSYTITVESAGKYTGIYTPPVKAIQKYKNPLTSKATQIADIPSSWDWRSQCTPIKDQLACGDCWAYATCGTFECNISITDGVTRQLSEEFITDCFSDNSCNGCDGGCCANEAWLEDYYGANDNGGGAVYAADDPETSSEYNDTTGYCDEPYTPHETIDSYNDIGGEDGNGVPSVDSIKYHIYYSGPIWTAVDATNWPNYWGWSFSGIWVESSPTGVTDHCVVMVGWKDTTVDDDSGGYWIIRNSWGYDWGNNGYMYITYGSDIVGAGADYIVYKGGTNSNGFNTFSAKSNDYLLYPNPAKNNITLETTQQTASIDITNIQGQLIENLATTGNKTNIDVSSLAKGMYFVKVKTEKGVAVKKFVKE